MSLSLYLAAEPSFTPLGHTRMLRYALIFLIVAFVAGALGFSGVASGAEGIAKILFVLFLIGAVVTFLIGSFVVKKVV